jgi:hypothetical protein
VAVVGRVSVVGALVEVGAGGTVVVDLPTTSSVFATNEVTPDCSAAEGTVATVEAGTTIVSGDCDVAIGAKVFAGWLFVPLDATVGTVGAESTIVDVVVVVELVELVELEDAVAVVDVVEVEAVDELVGIVVIVDVEVDGAVVVVVVAVDVVVVVVVGTTPGASAKSGSRATLVVNTCALSKPNQSWMTVA